MATAIFQKILDGAPPLDATTERILTGALSQFEDFGVRRTTMEDIARRTGVARVTVYRRFAAKERLGEAGGVWGGERGFSGRGGAAARLAPRAGRALAGGAR